MGTVLFNKGCLQLTCNTVAASSSVLQSARSATVPRGMRGGSPLPVSPTGFDSKATWLGFNKPSQQTLL
jgi:hypothetical protein